MNVKLLIFISLISTILAKPYTLNLKGNLPKENFVINLDLQTAPDGKLLEGQKIDLKNYNGFKSIKILTTPGLVGTLVDEREIIAYYKTSLNVNGLKIRNLYKVAIARVYDSENNITLTFDKDYYQNIVSLLKYHNIKGDILKDIDDVYGFWDEIDFSNQDKIKNNNKLLENADTIN